MAKPQSLSVEDVEKCRQLSELVIGYPRLAGYMERLPSAAFFRAFHSLASRDLLYRQAELVDLEQQLIELEKADSESSNEDRKLYSASWLGLSGSRSSDRVTSEQWAKMMEIRPKLKEYCK